MFDLWTIVAFKYNSSVLFYANPPVCPLTTVLDLCILKVYLFIVFVIETKKYTFYGRDLTKVPCDIKRKPVIFVENGTMHRAEDTKDILHIYTYDFYVLVTRFEFFFRPFCRNTSSRTVFFVYACANNLLVTFSWLTFRKSRLKS